VTGSSDEQTAHTLLLAGDLEKLRTHDGLTVARLKANRAGIAARLLELVATRRSADVHGLDPAAAAHDVVADSVRDLESTEQIVADAILALHLQTDIDGPVARSLYSSSLGRRREALLANWHQLHLALGQEPPEAPSDRILRGKTEPAVLRELARRLIQRSNSSTRVGPDRTLVSTSAPSRRAIVVGGAVMDQIFGIKTMPAPETSSEAYRFDRRPGGKALTQARALARLGFHASLIAAVGDDSSGDEILQNLGDEGVDISLIKRVPEARTPVTGVLENELGDSIAVNWRNQTEVSLQPEDMAAHYDQLTSCDVLLVTFEMPRETLQQTLAMVHRASAGRPLVIVTPGQPYVGERISFDTFSQIDCLVAHAWELGQLAFHGPGSFDPDMASRTLLASGVGTLCLLVNGGCTVYTGPTQDVFSVPTMPSVYKESSAARDAFCAALAAKLIENDRKFTDDVVQWAVAAMSSASANFRSSDAMPNRERIDALLTRSPFSVTGEFS
jgi:ribokinase